MEPNFAPNLVKNDGPPPDPIEVAAADFIALAAVSAAPQLSPFIPALEAVALKTIQAVVISFNRRLNALEVAAKSSAAATPPAP